MLFNRLCRKSVFGEQNKDENKDEEVINMMKKENKVYFCPNCNEIIRSDSQLKYACSKKHDHTENTEQSDSDNNTTESFTINSQPEKYPDCPGCKQAGKTTRNMPYDSVECPHCNKKIPLKTFKPDYDVYRICLAGSTLSGKTCYKSRLNMSILAREKGLRPALFKYPKSDIKHLAEGMNLPKSTPSITEDEKGDGNLKPDYIGFKTSEGKKSILIIYDIAGEDYSRLKVENDDKLEQWKKCILMADAIFFMIGPESFHTGNESNDNETGQEAKETAEVITDIMTLLCEEKENGNLNKLPKLAYIYTKLDDINFNEDIKKVNDEHCKEYEAKYLLWDKTGEPVYEIAEGLPDSSRILNDYLADRDDIYLFTTESDYEGFECAAFTVSALGIGSEIEKNEQNNNVLKKMGKAFRILDPIMWIINRDK